MSASIIPNWPDRFTGLPSGYLTKVMRDAIGHMDPAIPFSVWLPTANRYHRTEGYRNLRSFAYRTWGTSVSFKIPERGGDTVVISRRPS